MYRDEQHRSRSIRRMRILGFGGSLRRGSWNRTLLVEAREMMPDGFELDLSQLDVPGRLPLFNQDIAVPGHFPSEVEELEERLATADGLLLATPEYNFGIPGYLKNAIDWASRPPGDTARVFGGLPVALIGAGGLGGTIHAQDAWLMVFRYLKMRPWFGHSLFISRGWEHFDAEGRLTDDAAREQLRSLVEGFAAHCRDLPRTANPEQAAVAATSPRR
jgi:NAD(P)H-dependent FMN reductase